MTMTHGELLWMGNEPYTPNDVQRPYAWRWQCPPCNTQRDGLLTAESCQAAMNDHLYYVHGQDRTRAGGANERG